ncbi:MAG TPA: hypothetical protein VF583_22960, partial [Bradyrhizobium sp.]
VAIGHRRGNAGQREREQGGLQFEHASLPCGFLSWVPLPWTASIDGYHTWAGRRSAAMSDRRQGRHEPKLRNVD